VSRDRSVVVGGLPYFGRRLAALLDGDGWRVRYLETRRWQARAALAALVAAARADLIYLVGGQVERFSRPHLLRLALAKPTVMHWAGSDVLHARAVVERGRATRTLLRGVTHWAGAPWLADELRPLGVRARWLPHSWVEPAVPPPLPPGPLTVIAYLPDGRFDFYGGDAVLTVARALPDVRVLVAGATALPSPRPPNVTPLGWVDDMAALYARSHALLRLPAHDGLSFMVQEALALGRYALWNQPPPFAGVEHVAGVEPAVAVLRALAARQAAGALAPNADGMAAVRTRFSARAIRAGLLARFTTVLERRR
jgi:hypothetical protein